MKTHGMIVLGLLVGSLAAGCMDIGEDEGFTAAT
jgi:hypothetical protein